MYRVVRRFKDTKHDGHIYEVGDVYPADGFKAPTKKRLEELAGGKNKYGKVYIKKAADDAVKPADEGNSADEE